MILPVLLLMAPLIISLMIFDIASKLFALPGQSAQIADSVFLYIKIAHSRILLENRWTFLVQASDDVTSTFIDIG